MNKIIKTIHRKCIICYDNDGSYICLINNNISTNGSILKTLAQLTSDYFIRLTDEEHAFEYSAFSRWKNDIGI